MRLVVSAAGSLLVLLKAGEEIAACSDKERFSPVRVRLLYVKRRRGDGLSESKIYQRQITVVIVTFTIEIDFYMLA